jgi:hypothetical protein
LAWTKEVIKENHSEIAYKTVNKMNLVTNYHELLLNSPNPSSKSWFQFFKDVPTFISLGSHEHSSRVGHPGVGKFVALKWQQRLA